MIRFATVGTGKITDTFLSAAQLTRRYQYTALYSRKEETGRAFGKKYGISNIYTDLSALAQSDEIDAVYIASPNLFHGSQSKLFLEHGKNVICEKPIATSAEEYHSLKALADRNGLIYAEAITSRHVAWRQAVQKGLSQIGNIRLARLDYSQRSSRLDSFLAGNPQNIFDMSLHAGALMDLGVYCVYGAVDLFGMPLQITATADLFENGADHSGCAVFTYENFSAVLTYSKAGQSALGCEVIGDGGTLVLDSVSQYIGVKLIRNGTATELVGSKDRVAVLSGEAQDFADYIEGKKISEYREVSDLALSVHTCMDAIKKSARLIYPKK